MAPLRPRMLIFFFVREAEAHNAPRHPIQRSRLQRKATSSEGRLFPAESHGAHGDGAACIAPRDSYTVAMKLVGDSEAEAWLEALPLEAFEWDSGNRLKNAKHRVEPSEVESLFQRTVFLAGRIVEPAHDESRWLLLGETSTGRRLALIFTRRGSKLRPISCRQMRRNERRLYEEAKLETGSEEDR
jgi:uncharacterized DUF497 family protein